MLEPGLFVSRRAVPYFVAAFYRSYHSDRALSCDSGVVTRRRARARHCIRKKSENGEDMRAARWMACWGYTRDW